MVQVELEEAASRMSLAGHLKKFSLSPRQVVGVAPKCSGRPQPCIHVFVRLLCPLGAYGSSPQRFYSGCLIFLHTLGGRQSVRCTVVTILLLCNCRGLKFGMSGARIACRRTAKVGNDRLALSIW